MTWTRPCPQEPGRDGSAPGHQHQAERDFATCSIPTGAITTPQIDWYAEGDAVIAVLDRHASMSLLHRQTEGGLALANVERWVVEPANELVWHIRDISDEPAPAGSGRDVRGRPESPSRQMPAWRPVPMEPRPQGHCASLPGARAVNVFRVLQMPALAGTLSRRDGEPHQAARTRHCSSTQTSSPGRRRRNRLTAGWAIVRPDGALSAAEVGGNRLRLR
jgi:hypothetical protein